MSTSTPARTRPAMTVVASKPPAGPPERNRDDKLYRLLTRARDIAVERLAAAIKLMLDKVDDSLFEFAEKSDNNNAQRGYLDAMREVRLKRTLIEAEFASRFGASFDLALENVPRQAVDEPALGELGLVTDEAVEEEIAVSNMAEKIATACREELYALDRRIGLLLRRPTLETADNPLGPKAICTAIRGACTGLDAAIEVRLVVLKLFDRHVAGAMAAVYHEINQYLADHKVLPEIRSTVRRPAQAGFASGVAGVAGMNATAAQTAAGAAGADAGAGVLQLLQSLLAPGAGVMVPGVAGGIAGPGAAAAGAAAGASGAFAGAAGPGIALHPAIVGTVESLTRLQQGVALEAAGGTVQALAPDAANLLRELKTSPLIASLPGSERMTVDIVAMLFDYILNDAALPDSLKASIARLQIPMVKVALLDKAFFSRKQHPARRLLNGIAEAAIGRREDAAALAALQVRVDAVVHRVLDEFDDDVEIFSALAADFERFVATEWQEEATRAERSAKVVQGRERVEQAKIHARDAIERCAARHGHNDLIYNFLLSHWKALIITSFVECGEGSAALEEAIRTMDDLAWSVTPKATAADRDRFSAMLPGLLKRLRRGMETMSTPPIARQGFLTKLERLHAEAMKHAPAAAPAVIKAPPKPAAVNPPDPAPAPVAAVRLPDPAPAAAPVEPLPAAPAPAVTADLELFDLAQMPADPCERTLPDPHAGAGPDAQGMDAGGFDACERTLPNPDAVPVEPEGCDPIAADAESPPMAVAAAVEDACAPEAASPAPVDAPAWVDPAPTETAAGELPAIDLALFDMPGPVEDPCDRTLPEGFAAITAPAAIDPAERTLPDPSLPALGTVAPAAAAKACPDPVAEAAHAMPASEAIGIVATNDAGAQTGAIEIVDVDDAIEAIDATAMQAPVAIALAEAAPQSPAPEVEELPDMFDDPSAMPDFGVEDIEIIQVPSAPGSRGAAPDLAELMSERLRTHGSVTVSELLADRGTRTGAHAAASVEPAAIEDLDFDALYKLASQGGSDFDRLLAASGMEIEEMTLDESDGRAGAPDDPHVTMVAGLSIGAWIEFTLDDGRRARGRLSWINTSTDNFVFTDERGQKLLDRTRNGLVLDLRRGTARPAPAGGEALLDRAFTRLLDGLSTHSRG
ncbi:MAG: DUF1631 family protein [Gammaproteobacteria bacterium]